MGVGLGLVIIPSDTPLFSLPTYSQAQNEQFAPLITGFADYEDWSNKVGVSLSYNNFS
jgi:hypothetical protein